MIVVFFVLLLVGKRSDRARKRRPVKIVSFDTDDTGTSSSPASSVVSPTALISSVCNVAVSAKTSVASGELDDSAMDIVNALSSDAASSCRSEAVDASCVPASVAEPCASFTADKTSCSESNIVDTSSDGLTLPKHCDSVVESEFSRHRTSSLPNMRKDFSTESCSSCSEDVINVSGGDINFPIYSSSSTVKSDNFEGPQDLPSDNTWFGAFRDRASNVKAADAESIGSNGSTASSSSANNQSWYVSFACWIYSTITTLVK